MTRFLSMLLRLAGRATKREDGLHKIPPQILRAQAQQAYEAAVRAGDTRRQHETWSALFAATNDTLRAGL